MRKKQISNRFVLLLVFFSLGLVIFDQTKTKKIVLAAQQSTTADENSDRTLLFGRGKEVIRLPKYYTSIEPHDFVNNKVVQTIYIPKTVHIIYNSGMGAYPFTNCPKLSNIHVDKENTILYSIDGVLFKKQKKYNEEYDKMVWINQLVRYPEAKQEGTYEIPNDTQQLYTYGFRDTVALKKVIIPESMTAFLQGTEFEGCINLQTFEVDKKNEQYTSVDGIVYNKDMSEIRLYPEGREDKNFTVPAKVKRIPIKVLHNSKIQNLTILNDKIEIDDLALPNGDNFTLYCNPGSNAEAYAKKFKITYHLLKEPAPFLSLPYKTITIQKGKKTALDYELKDTKELPKFKSSNPKVAKVNSSGIITAVKAGSCVIQVSLNNQTPLKCKIVVPSKYRSSQKITLNAEEKTLQYAQSYSLRASILPKNVSDSTIYYKSTNTNVASVDRKGKVTATGNGTADIIASTRDGKSAVCHITVTSRPISIHNKNIYIGDSVEQLTKALGKPDRIDEDIMGTELYIYNKNIEQLAIIGVLEHHVVSIYTDSSDFEYWGVKRGSTENDIKNQTNFDSENTRYTSVQENNISAIFYKDNNGGANEVFAVKVHSDILNNQTVRNKQSIYDGYEKQIADLTNSFRSHHGLHTLQWSEKAHLSAKEHSIDMAKNRYMGHISPDGSEPRSRMQLAGIQSNAYGENCAMSSYDAIDVFMAWVHHGPHKDTLLAENYNYIGVGACTLPTGIATYYTMNIYH